MIIGYKRYSGPIGISGEESAFRSLWFEKRIALKKLLESRGHKVVFLSPPTPPSKGLYPYPPEPGQKFDVLMIEFGGTNFLFHRKDILETMDLIKNHSGKIVYINDDPLLVPPIISKTDRNGGIGQFVDHRWRIWLNAKTDKMNFHEALKMDPMVPIFDFPVASIMDPESGFRDNPEINKLIYIGSCADSRWKKVKELVDSQVPLDIAATTKLDERLTVGEYVKPPSQSERRAFYGKYLACLAISDLKHKKWNWRTGRAYHALFAGIPAIVEGSHTALVEDGFPSFNSTEELQQRVAKLQNPAARKAIWENTYGIVKGQFSKAIAALEGAGL